MAKRNSSFRIGRCLITQCQSILGSNHRMIANSCCIFRFSTCRSSSDSYGIFANYALVLPTNSQSLIVCHLIKIAEKGI